MTTKPIGICSADSWTASELMRSEAYSLVELLTACALVSLLAVLLAPALNQAKQSARSAQCLNNLKQLQLGWLTYVDANNDALPPNNAEKRGFFQVAVNNEWGNSWVLGNARLDSNSANLRLGALFAEVGNAKAYRCPADRSTVIGNASQLRFRSYSANAWLNVHMRASGLEQGVNTSSRNLKKRSQMVNPSPSGVFVFIDEHQQSIGDGVFGIPLQWYDPTQPPQPIWWWGASMPSDRHRQGCNLSFADGHVEPWTWRAPKRGMPEGDAQRAADSRDADDLRRLQNACPQN